VVGQLVSSKATTKEAADDAIQVVLGWLANKQGVKLPDVAYAGESFELDASESFPVSAVRFDEFWAVQFDRFADDVPGRIWRTEATVGYTKEAAFAGVRLAVIDSRRDIDFVASIPAVVSNLIVAPGLFEYGVPLSNHARIVSTPQDTKLLVELIRNPSRTRPVVVFSTTSGVDAYAEAGIAAEKLAGVAHVFLIYECECWTLTKEFGQEFSVWGGAVRTYQPNFDPTLDEVFRHPIATRDWINRRFNRIEHFIFTLLQSFAPATVRRANLEDDLPAFRTIKQAGIQQQLKMLNNSMTSRREELLLKEIELLNQRLDEKSAEYIYADQEVKNAEEERDQYRAQLHSLRGLIDRLENQLGNNTAPLDCPATLDALDEWVVNNFPGRLVLLNRAARAARKSPFNDPAIIYKCLERLAKQYVDARRKGEPVEEIFSDIGVHIERTGDPIRLAQWKNEYFVSHRGKSTFLEWHLKRGSDKNESTTMRIYYFYDEEDEQVVVGYLPGHLTNSKS
jgi:hypothetical protein